MPALSNYEFYGVITILVIIGAIAYFLIKDSGGTVGHTTIINKNIKMSWSQWAIYTVISAIIAVVGYDKTDVLGVAIQKLNHSPQTKPIAKTLMDWKKKFDKLIKT